MSDNEVYGFVRTKLKMDCWKDSSIHFLIDLAAMKFNLGDKQRLRLHNLVD